MADEIAIPQIIDKGGVVRRLGTLISDPMKLRAMTPYSEAFPNKIFDPSDIRRIIADPNRLNRRATFNARWRTDQKSHGSCNGFAIANCAKKIRFLRGIDDGWIPSGAYSYSKMNGHRDNGSAIVDDVEVAQKWGFAPADLVTWDMIYPESQPANADAEAAKHKGILAYITYEIVEVLSALAVGFPCVVVAMAGNRFLQLDSDGIAGVDNGVGNHAISSDDVVDIKGSLVLDTENSWGTSYGTQGRMYLRQESIAQTIKAHGVCVLPSMDEFPE